MKLAFINRLTELAESDPRIMLLVGDLGFQIFDTFIERFELRYVNVGVAEAQMVCAAAGLAAVGYRPVTYSIASFATARCFEQIKLAVAYPNLPVVIVGAGGGYAYCSSGVTHHAGEDLALLCSLPGMTVVAPGNVQEVRDLLPQVMQLPGPAYFRIGRGKEPSYHIDRGVDVDVARSRATTSTPRSCLAGLACFSTDGTLPSSAPARSPASSCPLCTSSENAALSPSPISSIRSSRWTRRR